MDETTGPAGELAETRRRIADDVAVELERAESLGAVADAADSPLGLPELGYYEAELQSLRHALRSQDDGTS